MHAKRFFWLALMLALAGSAGAQERPTETGPAHAVRMFNVFCLSQLPDLDGVRKAAGFGEFAQITGKELEQYRAAAPADELYAWSFHDAGGKYVLTATRAKPGANPKTAALALAKSTGVACSLLFPATAPKDALLKELSALLGRAPARAWDEGTTRVYLWSGQTGKLLSHVYYYAPAADGPPGVLSASIFAKD